MRVCEPHALVPVRVNRPRQCPCVVVPLCSEARAALFGLRRSYSAVARGTSGPTSLPRRRWNHWRATPAQ